MLPKLILDIETVPIDGAGEYVEEPSAPSNYKDAVKIAEYVADAKRKAIERAGLDPDLGRICAIGWMQEGRDVEPVVIVCPDEAAERRALLELWLEIMLPNGGHRAIVSFNGLRFDLPFVLRRSLYLHVDTPHMILDRYRTPHIDLEARLSYNGTIKEHSLAFYAKRFALPVAEPEIDGSMIATLAADGSWDAIRAHCASDVLLTHALASRLGYIEQPAEDRDMSEDEVA